MLHIALLAFLVLWTCFIAIDLFYNGATLWFPNVVLAYVLPIIIFVLSKYGKYSWAAWIASLGFPLSILLTIVLEIPVRNFVVLPTFMVATLLCASFLLRPGQALFIAIVVLWSQFVWVYFDPRVTLTNVLPGIGVFVLCGLLLLIALEIRRRDEVRRRAELEVSKLVLSQLPDAVVVTDYHGLVDRWLGNAEEIFGLRAEEMKGKRLSSLFAGPYEEKLAEMRAVVAETGRYNNKFAMKNSAGQLLDISVSIQRLYPENAPDDVRAVVVMRDETNKVRAQEALAKSEIRYQQLISASLFPVFVANEHGVITYANQMCCRLLGATEDGLAGQPLSDLFRQSEFTNFPVAFEGFVADDAHTPLTMEMRTLDGRLIDVELKGMRFEAEQSSHVFVLQDITERVNVEQRRRRSEELTRKQNRELVTLNELARSLNRNLFEENFLHILYEEVGQKLLQADYFATFEFDASFNNLICTSSVYEGNSLPPEVMNRPLANTPFTYLMALGQPRVLGWQKGYDSFFPQIAELFDKRPAEMLFMPLMAGTQLKGVIWAVGRTKGRFEKLSATWMSTLASQIAVALENVHLFKLTRREIEERRKAEAALALERQQLSERVEERTIELQNANADLLVALQHREQFLATVSHELRTPLTGILGMAEALLDTTTGDLSEKQLRSLGNIEGSGRHLLALINDLLDYSRLQSGRFSLDIEKTDVRGICEASQAMVSSLVQSKQLRLLLSIDPGVTTMQADSRRMMQVLVNLLGNAVKFTPVGGEIGLSVTQDSDANRIRFIVSDSGIGIQPEEQARIFEPFYQLDQGLDRRYGGTGLGLSLVKELVALHGGTIEVTSVENEGSDFAINLPIEQNAQELQHFQQLLALERQPIF